MKKIPLSQGKFALIDDEDWEKIKAHGWHAARRDNNFYAQTNHEGSTLQMHRIIMNAPKGIMVDHKNCNGLDNRKSNLRLCYEPSLNCANARRAKTNTSGFKGVSWHAQAKKWRAVIGYRGKIISLGLHGTPKKAHQAYVQKAKELFGEFHRSA